MEQLPDIEYFKELDKKFSIKRTDDGEWQDYTEPEYKELQRNLVLYKEGNREATTYIIKAFHQFISKYVKFIKQETIPYVPYTDKNGDERYRVDQHIARFVALFMDKTLEKEYSKKKAFSMTCVKIKALFAKFEYLDIYNELVLALLNMANKYKITQEGDIYHKENGTFHMYISKCFHWEAYKYLKKLVSDPLAHFDVMTLVDHFIDLEEENANEGIFLSLKDPNANRAFEEALNNINREMEIKNANTLTFREVGIDAYNDDALNFNWTNGVTCGELFKSLTPYERELVLLNYGKNKTLAEIAALYGLFEGTIGAHKRKAVQKIKEEAIKHKRYIEGDE